MGFDWRDYLELAKQLGRAEVPQCTEEAEQRTAVSRAYYAAYCFARNRERDRRSFEPGPPDGQRARFHQHLARTGKRRWLDSLKELQRWREACDYDDAGPGPDLAARAIAAAEFVITRYP